MIRTKVDFTPVIQDLLLEIGAILEKIDSLPSNTPLLSLRKENQVRTIFSTTKIEGNALNFEAVTAVIDGKRVKGDQKQILEIKNALKVYKMLGKLNPSSEMDFLLAHRALMKDLIKSAGEYRKVAVGIKSGNSLKTIFPPAVEVKKHCSELFNYLNTSNDNFLIKSCIAHYLIESIHPFEDGNGRLGRFWQTLMLFTHDPFFEHLPIENQILSNQQRYYDALEVSQKSDDPTIFVQIMLELLKHALSFSLSMKFESTGTKRDARINKAKEMFGKNSFLRRDYLSLFVNLSDSMATKDLRHFVNEGILNKTGNKASTKYWFNE